MSIYLFHHFINWQMNFKKHSQLFAYFKANLESLWLFLAAKISSSSILIHFPHPRFQNYSFRSSFIVLMQHFWDGPVSWTSLWNICYSEDIQTLQGRHGSFQCVYPDFLSKRSWSCTACIGMDVRPYEFLNVQRIYSLRILWIHIHVLYFR